MIPYERALQSILKNSHSFRIENVLTEGSIGRVLSEDIYSGIEMPPFNKSAMDGYAVRALDTKGAPVKLKSIGLIQAGESFGKQIKKGQCVKIMTGAAMPEGADSVVMVENTRGRDDSVEILKEAIKGENVCFKGEDLKKGKLVLKEATVISSSHVALLATLGRQYVKVISKPRVVILNTGGEIVALGKKLDKHQIYNSNGPMLSALLKADSFEDHFLGIVKDNVRELKAAIIKGLKADVLLISGGVSMGDYDLVPAVLRDLGVKNIFHKVNIKPGKPLFFGAKNKTIVFGIPGNPVSNFLSYFIFIRPALNKISGYKSCGPEFKQGIIETEFRSKSGRKHFVPVKISKRKNLYYLDPVESHGSADTSALSQADGFMIVDEDVDFIKKDTCLRFITWKTI